MRLKVFLTDGSIVTINNMTAEDFKGLMINYRRWLPLKRMMVNLMDPGKGYIDINKISAFVEMYD